MNVGRAGGGKKRERGQGTKFRIFKESQLILVYSLVIQLQMSAQQVVNGLTVKRCTQMIYYLLPTS